MRESPHRLCREPGLWFFDAGTREPVGSRTTPIPPKISPELQQRIKEAKEHLEVAERELEAALNELDVAERADKKMISHRLELAFQKLAAGRRNLESVLEEQG